MGSCINVSQKNNLVVIKINSEAKIEDIIPQIKKKVMQLQKIYKDEKTPIMVTGKVLKNKEIDEIEEIIKEKLDVDVDFDMPKELGLHNIKRTFIQEISVSETVELLVERALLKGGRDNITVILCELVEQEKSWFGKLLNYFL